MYYIAMDFIEGENLRVVLQREGRLSVDRSLAILTRVLKVLEIAYSHQIIHRDIKPDNILLAAVGGRDDDAGRGGLGPPGCLPVHHSGDVRRVPAVRGAPFR